MVIIIMPMAVLILLLVHVLDPGLILAVLLLDYILQLRVKDSCCERRVRKREEASGPEGDGDNKTEAGKPHTKCEEEEAVAGHNNHSSGHTNSNSNKIKG